MTDNSQTFSPCIIVPSYISSPERAEEAIRCINTFYAVFQIPIYVLAQEWTEEYEARLCGDIRILHSKKLGITHARKILRKWVLEHTDHTDFIMCDDDCRLQYVGLMETSQEAGQRFLKIVEAHPGQYALTRWPYYLSLAVFSRAILEQVDFADVSVMAEEGYSLGSEDLIFTAECSCRFPEKRYYISSGLAEFRDDNLQFKLSTWNADGHVVLAERLRILNATMEYLFNQPWFFPLPDNELAYSGARETTYYLCATFKKYGSIMPLFKKKE